MFALYKGENMMGKKKRSFISLLATLAILALICAAMPAMALADPGDSGTTDIWCWTELPDGTLSVTGCTYATTAVVSLTLPESLDTKFVTRIENGAFQTYEGLTSITLPDGLKSIGDRAFYGCSKLTGITLPVNLVSIGNEAFGCTGLTGITIPGSVTSVGLWAFSPCYKLETVVMLDNPTGTTTIGSGAFASCSSLNNVTLPHSLESIGDQMFQYCAALTSIDIPDSVTSIASSAFQNCPSLESVTLPDNASFTSIPPCAFYGCGALNSVTIPSNVISIGSSAFYQTGFTTIAIPDSITSIDSNAFQNCPNLASVTLPDNAGFTSIPGRIFNGCQALASIEIPSHVTSIGRGAFGSCPSLTTISVNPANTHFSSQDGILYNKDKSILVCYPGVSGAFSIPDSVTAISEEAFSECSSLTEVTIQESVTSIGDGAFCDCENLSKAIIHSGSAIFGDYVFEGTAMPPDTAASDDGIYGLDGSTAEQYAQNEGILFHIIGGPASTYALTITAGTGGSITSGSSGNYAESAVINIAAAASANYSFNKWTSSNGGSFADANSSTTTFTMPAGVTTITANFTSNSSSPGGGGGGGSSSTSSTTTQTYSASFSENGTTGNTLPVTVDTDAGSAAVDLETSTEDIFAGARNPVITVPSIPGVDDYTLGIASAYLSASQGQGALTFSTGAGSITLPGNMLAGIEGQEAGITIGQGDTSGLSDEVRAAIGDRPLVQLTLTVDGEQRSWNNPDAPVTVAIPYTPTAAEMADPEHITVWYLDGSGNAVSVTSGRYDPATGTVTFTTTHFSHYAVVYVAKTFTDLGSAAWAQKTIEALASKGILTGITEKEYAPQANITRADFLCFLVRTLDLAASVDGNFDDIDSSAPYYREIAIAKKLGVTSGTGSNKFNPGAGITRQDMMALTERALRMLDKLKVQGDSTDLDKFADKALVAAYAADSVSAMVKEGLIVGSGGKINPLGNTTRAEAAALLYRIYNKY